MRIMNIFTVMMVVIALVIMENADIVMDNYC